MGAQRERHTPSVQVQGAHIPQNMRKPPHHRVGALAGVQFKNDTDRVG